MEELNNDNNSAANKRAAYFSVTELQLLMEGYEEVKHLLKTKGNTVADSKVRQDAWRNIAAKINASNPKGPKRSWQQVKVKYKNIRQTARRKRAKIFGGPTKHEFTAEEQQLTLEYDGDAPIIEHIVGSCSELESVPSCSSFVKAKERMAAVKMVGCPTKEEFSVEEDLTPDHNENGPIIETVVGGSFSDPGCVPSCSSYVRVTEHGVTLLQPPSLTEEDEAPEPVEDVKTLYRQYLQVEMANRKQEMAYRALKMRKVEKEIELLNRKLAADP